MVVSKKFHSEYISFSIYKENTKNYHKLPLIYIYLVQKLKEIDEETSIIAQEENKLKLLEELYILNNETKVKTFLKRNPFLIDILLSAENEIREVLEENISSLELELHKDPEEGFEKLFLVVKTTNASPEKLIGLLEKIDDEWYLNLDYETRKNFNIMIE